MEAIEAVLPAADGLSCFGRTYHDLPVAMVSTCTTLATAPDAAPQLADYQKVDQLLMPDWAVITAELSASAGHMLMRWHVYRWGDLDVGGRQPAGSATPAGAA